MNLKSAYCVLVALALVGALVSCASGKRPFLLAQVCLRNADDLSMFTQQMQLIAQSEGTTLIDNSASTQNELDAMGHSFEGARNRPVINMGIEWQDGSGMLVSNLGLPDYQVVVGFSEGSSLPRAQRFAQKVVGKLEERWRVEFVPDPAKSGALPMADCK